MANNSFRNGKVHVCAKRCKTCIFHPGNLMHLKEGRRDEMVAGALASESAIICHSTLDGDNAVCRGFYDEHTTMPLRLAEATGNIEWQASD